jgi:hypothetical protein
LMNHSVSALESEQEAVKMEGVIMR